SLSSSSCFVGTISCCDLLTVFSPRFVFFCLAIPRSAYDSCPFGPKCLGRWIIPEFAVPVGPGPVVFREQPRSPEVPGNLPDHSPCFLTPARPGPRCGTNCQQTRHSPRVEPRRRLSTLQVSRLYPTAFGLAICAS